MKIKKRSGDRRPRASDPTSAVAVPHLFSPTWARVADGWPNPTLIVEEVRCAVCGEKLHE